MIRITKGLDLPISGVPVQTINEDSLKVESVAVLAGDYVGMKPTMQVSEGERVRLGQVLFSDKKTPGVVFTSPACGTVKAINRGAKRAFQNVEIAVEGEDAVEFSDYGNQELTRLSRDQVVENLVNSGLWTSLRTRPYSRVPAIDAVPHSIFVNAMDSNPLAVDPGQVILRRERDFIYGLQVLKHLTEGPLFLCRSPKSHLEASKLDFVNDCQFSGPHPAGLVGTHIHFLDPAGPNNSVWHVNYQDVIAIGHLFVTGRLDPERIISIAGPMVREPAIVRTQLGAAISELLEDRLVTDSDRIRVISGSVLSGRQVEDPLGYLGRYDLQVSCIEEGMERELLGWQRPGFDKFSISRAFASAFAGVGRKFAMTTSTNGSRRSMVPIGSYEKVMPLDIIPTFLLRSLIVGDTEQAQALGCLELDEEDLALCTFVCPSKYEYGSILRENLDRIEKEG